MKPIIPIIVAALVAISGLSTTPSSATAAPYSGTREIKTAYAYKALTGRLIKAIQKNRMGIVARASATIGAKSIGKTIPGNMVIMVFRPDFAVRMLKASVPAGIEAPLRFYVTENDDGKASLTYRMPTSTFAPYGSPDLNRLAGEIDILFGNIVRDALKP
ncbi:MAG: DUF302 domain-containing protein [Rhodospirillales bacterium]|nr:DUF302 domain-containing protein [Rhodospirillales bacterium]